MSERKVHVFFYGPFMSRELLEKAGVSKRAFAPATLPGFDFVIAPRATLVDSGDGVVYGILANLTHNELLKLYKTHLPAQTETPYLPEAVLVKTRGGKIVPATVYLASETVTGTPSNEYVDNLAQIADSYGFPQWYVERIQSFKTD